MKYILIFLSLTYLQNKPHSCNWAGCDYKGLTVLPAKYNPIDSIHFMHPAWKYEKAEALIK